MCNGVNLQQFRARHEVLCPELALTPCVVAAMEAFTNRLALYVMTAGRVTDLIKGLSPSLQTFSAGSDIVQAGTRLDTLYIIQSGWAIRYKSIEDGRRQIMNFMLPGDIFDVQAFGELEADHSVAAINEVVVVAVNADEFRKALEAYAEAATAFWWALVQEESILREQIMRVGRLSARERIGHLLLELQRRLGAALGEDPEDLGLPLTRTHLADALGLTAVHVSRMVTALKRDRLIEENRMYLKILDRARLAALSQFDPDYVHITRLRLQAHQADKHPELSLKAS